MNEITVWDAEDNVFEWGLATFKNPSHAKGQKPTRYVAETRAGVSYILSKLNNYVLEEVNLYPNQYIRPCFDKDSEGIPIDYEKDMEMIREILGDVEIKIESREPRDKHNNGKVFYSARYVVQERRIRRNQLSDLIRWNKNVPEKYFDVSVYGDGGQFFTVYNNKKFAPKGSSLKYIDVPPLLPVNDEDVDVLDYCITYVLEEWDDYDDVWGREWEKKELEKEKKVKVVYKEEDCEKIELELNEIIKRLSAKRADDYCDWRGVCFALINCGIKCNLKKRNVESLIHDFSAKCDDKYEDDLVEKWFETTYYNLANSKAQKKLGRNYLINTCLKEDDYEYWRQNYKNRSYEVVLDDFNKECVRVLGCPKWIRFCVVDDICKMPYELLSKEDLVQRYAVLGEYFYQVKNKDNDKINEYSIVDLKSKFWKDPNCAKYDRIIYAPLRVDCGRYFNTWTGWKASAYPVCKDYSRCEVFINHLKGAWCKDDERLTKWFLEYFSGILRGGHTCVCPIVRGKQGSGKDCFMSELFMNKILGNDYSLITNDPCKHIFGSFNGALLNKSFVVIEEGSYDLEKSYGQLKSLITSESIAIEAKYMNVINTKNYCNPIVSTNRHDILKGDKGMKQRRLIYIECDPVKRSDEYYKKYFDALEDESALSAFYHYLLDPAMVYQYDINNLAYLQNSMPDTKLGMDIAYRNIPQTTKFLKQFFTADELKEHIDNNPHKAMKILGKDLQRQYKKYCEGQGLEKVNLEHFTNSLLNNNEIEYKKHSAMYYVIPYHTITALYAMTLKDDEEGKAVVDDAVEYKKFKYVFDEDDD